MKGSERREIKKSKGMSEVSEKAMNHGDTPGWVSEAAAVWSWINRRPLKQSYLNTGLVGAHSAPLENSNGCQILVHLNCWSKSHFLSFCCHKPRNVLLANVSALPLIY